MNDEHAQSDKISLRDFRNLLRNHDYKVDLALGWLKDNFPHVCLEPAVFAVVADELAHDGCPLEAREVSDAGIKLFPNDIKLIERRAALEADIGYPELHDKFINMAAEARSSLKAMRRAKERAENLFFSGRDAAMNDDYTLALDLFEQAFALNPNDNRILDRLTRTCLDLEDWEKAIKYGDLAIVIEPNFADHYFKLAMAHIKVGELDHAFDAIEELLEKYMQLEPSILDNSRLIGALKFQKILAQTDLYVERSDSGERCSARDKFWSNALQFAEKGLITPEEKEDLRISPHRVACMEHQTLVQMPIGTMKSICGMLSGGARNSSRGSDAVFPMR